MYIHYYIQCYAVYIQCTFVHYVLYSVHWAVLSVGGNLILSDGTMGNIIQRDLECSLAVYIEIQTVTCVRDR